MLSFQDADVTSGHSYFYYITAIDIRGNESAKSSEATQALR
jgi:fibronectin type 3 domain-containing protein